MMKVIQETCRAH